MKNFLRVLSTLLFTFLITPALYASEESPPDTPPQLESLTEVEPAITSGKKERIQSTEHTSQIGEQTEVKVTNDVGTYVVRPNQSVGTSLPGDAQSSSNHAVQWVIKRWGGSKNTDPTAAPPGVENNSAPSSHSDNQAK